MFLSSYLLFIKLIIHHTMVLSAKNYDSFWSYDNTCHSVRDE